MLHATALFCGKVDVVHSRSPCVKFGAVALYRGMSTAVGGVALERIIHPKKQRGCRIDR